MGGGAAPCSRRFLTSSEIPSIHEGQSAGNPPSSVAAVVEIVMGGGGPVYAALPYDIIPVSQGAGWWPRDPRDPGDRVGQSPPETLPEENVCETVFYE